MASHQELDGLTKMDAANIALAKMQVERKQQDRKPILSLRKCFIALCH